MVKKKTIVLVIIFLALLAYVYFFEIQGEKRKQAHKEKEEQILDLDKEKVSGLSFLPAGIIVKKEDFRWKISSPVQTESDQSTIENILDNFNWLKKGRFVSDNPNDFKKFGLSPYQAALVIHHEGDNDTLFLGDNNLDNTKVFYRKSGSNNVYLVATNLQTNALKTLHDLRDKSVLKFEKQEITKILIEKNRRIFSCYKDKDQQWWLEHPIKEICDEDKIDDILNELNNSKIARFESEQANNLKKYDLQNPWLIVTLFDSSRTERKTLYVGKKDDKRYYAKDEARPAIFVVDSSMIAELNVTLFDLRDKTIVTFEQDSITELLLVYPDFSFHCVKDSSKRWWMTQPDSGLVKSWKISSLLYDIKDIKVAQFLDGPPRSSRFYGFDDPAIKLILKKGEGILTDLLIGKKVDDKVYLKNNLTNKVYKVKTKVKDELKVKANEFLEDNN